MMKSPEPRLPIVLPPASPLQLILRRSLRNINPLLLASYPQQLQESAVVLRAARKVLCIHQKLQTASVRPSQNEWKAQTIALDVSLELYRDSLD